jgi:hypothetical protein
MPAHLIRIGRHDVQRAAGIAAGALACAGLGLIAPAFEAAFAQEQPAKPAEAPREIVVYASDIPKGGLSEFAFWKDPASPGGKLVGTPNTGGHLDPPPESDPHVNLKVQVQAGVPYRCWIHMKVGTPKGQSQANMLWVQFTNATDKAGREILKPGTGSYLTAQGPAKPGWVWVPCVRHVAGTTESLVTFKSAGEINVRLQAGMEGVGFDQLVLSPARYLEKPPADAVVKP